MPLVNSVGKQAFTVTGSRTITADWTSRQFTNHHHKGVRLVVNRSAATGTDALDVKVQYKNQVTGTWTDLEGAQFTQWADGVFEVRALTVYPGITAADADANIALDTDNDHLCGQYLPLYWRVYVTNTGTDNTFSIGGTYLP